MSFLVGRASLLLAPFFAVAGFTVVALCAPADELARVIENIAANEELYKDADVKWEQHYRLDLARFTEAPGVYVSRKASFHAIFQGDFFKQFTKENGVDTSGKRFEVEMSSAYDGIRTLEVGGDYVKVIHGGAPACRQFMPHKFLLEGNTPPCIPLSVLLRGGDALRSHPFASQREKDASAYRSVAYEGEREVDGLKTVRVRLNSGSTAARADFLVIDFVPSRNYLPIRSEFYYWTTPKLARSVDTASDWRELTPGVWLPFKLSRVQYDDPSMRKGIHQACGFYETQVLSADVTPKRPAEFFSELPLPANAMVYEVIDGKVVKKYELTPWTTLEGVTDSRRELWRWLAIGLAAVAVLLAFFWLRSRRQAARASAAD